MSDDEKQKPGLFARLFGRRSAEPEKSLPTESEPAPAAERPAPTDEPDFANAARDAAPAAAATVTEASPDTATTVAADLAGASLQPVEGNEDADRPPEAPAAGRPTEAPALTSPGIAQPPAPAAPEAKRSWWRRLTEGLSRTSSSIGTSITSLFTKRKLDAETLEDLEDVLVQADLGVAAATRITEAIGVGRYDKEVSPDEVKRILASEVERALEPVAQPLTVDRGRKPFVILMVGVNGAGKTTTIGKLAAKFRAQGLSVMMAAGDTFRAAAIEQLKVWGERTGSPVVTRPQGADAAGLAFDALEEARGKGTDVLLIDTAGRLQNKAGLMSELEKIVRVVKKVDESAPHAVLLVLDATVGQNALSQVELFQKAAGVTGLVMTKLDGTARGGILVALADKFGLPVHFIGVGEGVDDLEPFAAKDFARAIAGLEEAA